MTKPGKIYFVIFIKLTGEHVSMMTKPRIHGLLGHSDFGLLTITYISQSEKNTDVASRHYKCLLTILYNKKSFSSFSEDIYDLMQIDKLSGKVILSHEINVVEVVTVCTGIELTKMFVHQLYVHVVFVNFPC